MRLDCASAGWSDAATRTPTPQRVVDDPQAPLQQANLPGPYVLVTHSDAGIPTELFAVEHQEEVAGLVLVDARQPQRPSRNCPDSPATLSPLQSPRASTTCIGSTHSL